MEVEVANPKVFKFLTRNGVADPGQENILAAMLQELQRADGKVLLHLHGGLIDEAAGRAIADRLSGQGPNNWGLGADWAQTYVIWRTGALETIRSNWTELARDDRLYQAVLRKLLGFVARKLSLPTAGGRSAEAEFGLDDAEIQKRITGRGDPKEPFSDVDGHLGKKPAGAERATIVPGQSDASLAMEFQDELAADDGFLAAIGDIDGVANETAAGRAPLPPGDRSRGAASLGRLNADIQFELQPPDGQAGRGIIPAGIIVLKHVAKIALRCFQRFRAERDHGLHATVVEELCRELYGDLIGAKIWGMMVQDAADHFKPGGLGDALVQGVKDGRKGRLVVTAHSAGSIWACRLLQALAQAGADAKTDLYLLAPAVRQSLFAETLKDAGHLIERCQMFTMDDAHERRDAVLGHDRGYIYPSSLLYLVSGLFEERDADAYADAPLLGMQRYGGVAWLDAAEAADAAAISEFFQTPGRSIIYSPTPGSTESTSHGDFDDDRATLTSIASRLATN
jgi:hypothetical protein